MEPRNEHGTRTFMAGAELKRFTRVALSDGKVVPAGADVKEIGVVERFVPSGDPIAVVLRNAPGTLLMIAAGAIPVGADVYTAAAGKVSASAGAGATRVGIALGAAAADNDVIEVMRVETGGIGAEAANGFELLETATETVAAADFGLVQTTLLVDFDGAVALAIPGGDAVPEGARLRLQRIAEAGAVTVTPADGTIGGGATYALVDADGDWAEFVSDGTNWILINSEIAD